LKLTEKTAGDAMTPISETFAIDINGKLDRYDNLCINVQIKFGSPFLFDINAARSASGVLPLTKAKVTDPSLCNYFHTGT